MIQIQTSDTQRFKYRKVSTHIDQQKQISQVNTLTHNAIFFQLEGSLQISWDDHEAVVVNPGELYFLPRGARISACIISDEIKYIAARLTHDIDHHAAFKTLFENEDLEREMTHSFTSLPIKDSLKLFVKSIKKYIVDGNDTPQIQQMKFIELYFILRNYYTKEECINLFYPIMKKNSKFITFVLDNYQASVSIDKLAEKANMSRSTFDRNFKENFGMTPLKWIDTQTRILIMRKASEPNATVKDIMYEVGVYNSSQFTKLCKRLCGMTPSELIRTK